MQGRNIKWLLLIHNLTGTELAIHTCALNRNETSDFSQLSQYRSGWLVIFQTETMPWLVVQLVGAPSCATVCSIPSQGACKRGNRSMLLTHINVSLCLSFSLPPLSLPLSFKSINISSGEDFLKSKTVHILLYMVF